MNTKGITFPVVINLLFGVCCILLAFVEASRVFPHQYDLYMISKMIFGVIGIGLAVYFYFYEATDLPLTISMVTFVLYCVLYIWLMPLYEAAYLQTAIGSAFYKLRRRWLFFVVFGLGLIGIFVSYAIQDSMGWTIPPVDRVDWQWVVSIFFILAALIQHFAIGVRRHEEDRLMRFSVVGVETTKLIHDLKGLLASPLLIIDDLKEQKQQLSSEQIQNQMTLLAQDMNHIQNVIKSIHRLVIQQDELKSLNLNESIAGALSLLERRLSHVSVNLPEERTIEAYPNRLHSVFFNLLLNSIEAFDRNKTQKPEIRMSWEGSRFHYQDNAGGFSFSDRSSKGADAGFGIAMLENDLRKMNARLKIHPEKNQTSFIIQFDD